MIDLLLFIEWSPSPDAIAIGNFAIKWYGLLWGAGLIAAWLIGRWVFKVLGKDEEKLTLAIQYVFVGALIGARLAHILFYQLDYYIAHPLEVFMVWKGGLASHGGIVGAVLGLYVFCERNKDYGFFWSLEHGALMFFTLASFIRLGNLINSELVGKVTELPWGFVFTEVDSLARHPVVLYESILYMFLQILLIVLFLRFKDSKPGLYITVSFLIAFIGRFLVEFAKEPEGALLFGAISKTQLLSVPFILVGFYLAYLVSQKKLRY